MKLLIWIAAGALLIWLLRKSFSAPAHMSADEAARILEIPLEADVETIGAAHRRLIAKVHPDAGGSAELAARVNMARDVLLRRISG